MIEQLSAGQAIAVVLSWALIAFCCYRWGAQDGRRAGRIDHIKAMLGEEGNKGGGGPWLRLYRKAERVASRDSRRRYCYPRGGEHVSVPKERLDALAEIVEQLDI